MIDPSWSAGARLDEFSRPLRTELLSSAPQSHIESRFDDIFSKNPPGSAIPEQDQVCHMVCGGLCRKMAITPLCSSVVYNIHATLKQQGINREKLPIMIRLASDSPCQENWLLADMFGRGQLQNLVEIGCKRNYSS